MEIKSNQATIIKNECPLQIKGLSVPHVLDTQPDDKQIEGWEHKGRRVGLHQQPVRHTLVCTHTHTHTHTWSNEWMWLCVSVHRCTWFHMHHQWQLEECLQSCDINVCNIIDIHAHISVKTEGYLLASRSTVSEYNCYLVSTQYGLQANTYWHH